MMLEMIATTLRTMGTGLAGEISSFLTTLVLDPEGRLDPMGVPSGRGGLFLLGGNGGGSDTEYPTPHFQFSNKLIHLWIKICETLTMRLQGAQDMFGQTGQRRQFLGFAMSRSQSFRAESRRYT